MKEGWKMVKLGEVCKKFGEYGMSVPSKSFDGIRYIRITDITENGNLNDDYVSANIECVDTNYILQEGDVLFARTGATVGKTFVYRKGFGKCVYAGYLIRYRPDLSKVISQYIYYYTHFQEYYDWVKRNQKAAAQPNISAKLYNNLELPLPPLEEQHRIVSILDASFEKIDALKKNAEENLTNAKALFQQVLAQELQPKEGWSLVQIRDVALLITKGASPKWQGNKYVEEDGILFVTSENVREGYIDISTPKYVDKTFNLKQQRSILYKDDVLVNIVGASIGRSAIFDLDIIDANINQAVALVRLDKTKLIPRLLCLYLNSNLAFEKYNSMKKDTARANLSLENIGDIELYIPKNITEQYRIVRTLDTLSEKCRRLEQVAQQTIRECDALKQSILRQAFSGEL